MSANIFGNRFSSYRQPAWHGLGQVFQDRVDLITAFSMAGLNYECTLQPVYVMDSSSEYLNTDKYRAVVREQIGEENSVVLAMVSDHYNLLQNMQIAEALNPISEYFPVETVGALGEGGEIFAALDAGKFDFMKDEYTGYFTIYENKLAKGKIKVFFTPVRTVCQNTLRLALASSVLTISIRHSKNAEYYLDGIAKYIEQMQNSMQSTQILFGDMVKIKFSLDDFEELVKKLYVPPAPQEKKGKAKEIILDDIPEDSDMIEVSEAGDLAIGLFKKFNDEFPQFGETAYAAYQVVVENENYRIPGRGPQNTAYSTMFGSRSNTIMNAQKLVMKG